MSMTGLVNFQLRKQRPLKAPHNGCAPDDPTIPYRDGDNIVSSPKFDGNRQLCVAGLLFTSDMQPPRNVKVAEFMTPLLEHAAKHSLVFDYEMFDTDGDHHGALSGVINSSADAIPDSVRAYVFDCAPLDSWEAQCVDLPYRERIDIYGSEVTQIGDLRIVPLEQRPCRGPDDTANFFDEDVEAGFEGSMLRSLDIWTVGSRLRGGFYKHGRATVPQSIIWKQKFIDTVDGIIIDVLQRRELRPDWPREYTADGRLKKVNNKDAFVLTDAIGAFKVESIDPDTGERVQSEVGFGRGYDMGWRRLMWQQYVECPAAFIGKWVEILHQRHGSKAGGVLRQGRFVRTREDLQGMTLEMKADIQKEHEQVDRELGEASGNPFGGDDE